MLAGAVLLRTLGRFGFAMPPVPETSPAVRWLEKVKGGKWDRWDLGGTNKRIIMNRFFC